MASGREDYWTRTAPQRVTLSTIQNSWWECDQKSIDSGESEFIINYTVPVGYKLVVTGLVISCRSPGINAVSFDFSGGAAGFVYFDVNYSHIRDSSGICEVSAGSSVLLKGWNLIEDTAFFWGCLYGFLEVV
jgi:hypothetical protein